MENQQPELKLAEPMSQEQARQAVTILKEARITVTTNDTAKTAAVYSCGRNFTTLQAYITCNFEAIKDTITEIKVDIGFSDGNHRPLISGTYAEVLQFFNTETLTSDKALEMLKFICTRFVECSSMDHALFILKFKEGTAGLGLYNDTLPVSKEDTAVFIKGVVQQSLSYVFQMATKLSDNSLHDVALNELIQYMRVVCSENQGHAVRALSPKEVDTVRAKITEDLKAINAT